MLYIVTAFCVLPCMCKAHGDNLNKEWLQENISEDTDVAPGDHHTAAAAVVVKEQLYSGRSCTVSVIFACSDDLLNNCINNLIITCAITSQYHLQYCPDKDTLLVMVGMIGTQDINLSQVMANSYGTIIFIISIGNS